MQTHTSSPTGRWLLGAVCLVLAASMCTRIANQGPTSEVLEADGARSSVAVENSTEVVRGERTAVDQPRSNSRSVRVEVGRWPDRASVDDVQILGEGVTVESAAPSTRVHTLTLDEANERSVTISAVGFLPETTNLAGSDHSLDIKSVLLRPTVGYCFQVLSPAGEPVTDATASLVSWNLVGPGVMPRSTRVDDMDVVLSNELRALARATFHAGVDGYVYLEPQYVPSFGCMEIAVASQLGSAKVRVETPVAGLVGPPVHLSVGAWTAVTFVNNDRAQIKASRVRVGRPIDVLGNSPDVEVNWLSTAELDRNGTALVESTRPLCIAFEDRGVQYGNGPGYRQVICQSGRAVLIEGSGDIEVLTVRKPDFHGRVELRIDGQCAVAADATVRVVGTRADGHSIDRSRRVNADGTFTIGGFESGEQYVFAEFLGFGESQRLPVSSLQVDRAIVLSVETARPSGLVIGSVNGPAGAAPGGRIEVYASDGGARLHRLRRAQWSADCQFALALTDSSIGDRVYLVATNDEGTFGAIQRVVVGQSDPVRIDLLELCTQRLQLANLSRGGVYSVCVDVAVDDQLLPWTSSDVYGSDGGHGSARLRLLPRSAQSIAVRVRDYRALSRPLADAVQLVGCLPDVHFEVPQLCQIEGTVLGASGAGQVYVAARNVSGAGSDARVDGEGTFILPALVPGSYRLYLYVDGGVVSKLLTHVDVEILEGVVRHPLFIDLRTSVLKK